MNDLALPADLPDIDSARLPGLYEAARTALANCANLDECQNWADRMAALASYARQSDDPTLMNHSMRIKARAVDRCGEILRSIPAAANQHEVSAGTGGHTGRMQAARDAGLSRHQAVTALRVHAVDRGLFERMVESDSPPTIEKLAVIGTKKPPDPPIIIDSYLQGRDPVDFEQATRLIGLFTWVEQRMAELVVATAVRGLNWNEKQTVNEKFWATLSWLSELRRELDGV